MVHRVDFKAIKESASFEHVLRHYGIELRGRGVQQKALCPFHTDTTPSLNINLAKKLFNCYPCGDGGDIIKFVAKKEHPTDPDGHPLEAAEELARICGIAIDNNPAKASAKPAERPNETPGKSAAETAPAPAAAPTEPRNGESAPVNPPLSFELKVDPAHPYLAERGLSPEIVEAFGLGYCVSESRSCGSAF